MTAISVSAPFPILTDIDGDPLDAGYVYIGQANLDPAAFPKAAYWDASLTTPAAQPIRTTGGYPVRNGSPARIYTDGDYSIRINNKNGTLVYSSPAATDRMDSWQIGYLPAGTGAVATTVQSKLRESVSVKDFGAVGDGVTNDTAAIQAALNAVQDGGSVYFPKVGGTFGPHYRITSGLTLTKNDVTLYSDPIAEYTEGIVTSNAITMLTVSGYGLKLQNLSFTGNGDSLVFGTANGVVIDRTSNGDAETYSNLDASITNCFFFRLNDAVRGKGRNAFLLDNTFSECKRGVVGELHTYSGGTLTSDFRGWRVSRNRFHSCGGQYINAESSVALPATLALLDSWCIQMPQTSAVTSHLEIFDNNADFCGAGFYKGYLAGSKISGNQTHGGSSIFVYANITDANNQAACTGFVQSIENNSINSRTADQNTDRGYLFSSHTFYVFGVANLTIQNNVMRQAAYQHIQAFNCDRLRIINNFLLNANNLWFQDSLLRNAITVTNGGKIQIIGNFIDSQLGNVYGGTIAVIGATDVKVRDNTVRGVSTTRYDIDASILVNGDDDGLAWQTPSMTNSYVLSANSRGYRRNFDGTVTIDVQVTGGTDNTAAFQLPAGYRPSTAIVLPSVSVWTDGSDAYAQIETSGLVVINWNGPAAVNYNVRHTFPVA